MQTIAQNDNTEAYEAYAFRRVHHYAQATTRLTTSGCLRCQGTGLVPKTLQDNGREYAVVLQCECSRLQSRAQQFNDAHLPAVHAQASFKSYTPSNVEQARAREMARTFVLRWPELRGYVLSGPVGTGKTHLLVATLKYLTLERGISCAYVEISLLYAQIRRGFEAGKSSGEIVQPLSNVAVLAIDELGKGRGSAFELETLDELISRRYNANKVTLFATHYSLIPPEEQRTQRSYIHTNAVLEVAKESKLLAQRIGNHIYSRMCEMCDFIEFPLTTPDARRAPAKLRTTGKRKT